MVRVIPRRPALMAVLPLFYAMTLPATAVSGDRPLPPAEAANTAGQGSPADLEMVRVSPSVVMSRRHNGSNSTCIALEDGLVFVDAGMSTTSATTFRNAMEAEFQRPTQALVLTHAHIDHILGMAAFADVPVFLASAGKELMERQLAITFDDKTITAYARIFPGFEEAIVNARPFLPTRWFEAETKLGRPGNELIVRRTGGHSSDSAHVYFPAEGVVAAGDLVQAHRRPYFGDPSTDLQAWIAALGTWSDAGVKQVCPGHGPVVDGAYLSGIRKYFEALTTAVASLKSQGVPVEEVVSHPTLPAGYWPAGDEPPPWWPSCIARLYAGL